MAVPVAGQIIRASDVITYLDARPRVHAYDATGVSCTNNVSTLITFDSEMYDSTGSMHTGGNPSRLIAPIDGLYEFYARVTPVAVSTTYGVTSLLNIRQNAAGAAAGGTSLQNTAFEVAAAATSPTPHALLTRALVAGDYLEVFMRQSSGAARLTIPGAYSTCAYMKYVASS